MTGQDRPDTGEIEGYGYAVLPHGLIAVRRPDGSMQTLPQADDPAAAVRAFIEKDRKRAG